MTLFRAIASHRTYLGVLLGIATWLLFVLLFGQSGLFVDSVAVFIAMWVSGMDEPKRLAGLGLFIGFPAAVYEVVQYFLQMVAPATASDAVGRIVLAILVGPVGVTFYSLIFSFEGFAVGSVAQLYKRNAIF